MKNLSKRFRGIQICLLLSAILLALSSCAQESGEGSKTEFALDTVINIKVFEPKTLSEEDWLSVFNLVRNVDKTMNVHDEKSEISKLNANAGVSSQVISKSTYDVLKEALSIAELTDACFEPTIGPLTSLWDIGAKNPRVPSESDIRDKMHLIDYKKLKLYEKTDNGKSEYFAELEDENMAVDVGAIAKGYAADIVKNRLVDLGVKKAILDFGGNILLIGDKSETEKWKIGLQNPSGKKGEVYATVRTSDEAVVSSGDYERFFEFGGKRYHHIIDPKTGYPTDNDLRGVTVIYKKSMRADAYSTALMCMGYEKARAFLNESPNIEAVFFFKNGEVKTHLSEDREFIKLD